ncbi:MAG TPA: UDP-glucose/GDP-mannose dehydrogenase family protein [Mycobacteriales bacterium]|nr:UDP-glucose/GDP-mannose dehydrogenase family protein [Mycobacteriales bacterium]
MSTVLSPWGLEGAEAGSRIAVIGSGYVGLTTAICFAYLGHQVTCTDVSADRVAALRNGELPIVEAGLLGLFEEALRSGRLTFSSDNRQSAATAHAVFLCLPTPEGRDGRADLRYIRGVAAEIGPVLPPGAIVVNKSTVPVGTADRVAEIIERDDIEVVSNPEFLAEGTAVHDFLNPDRIVIGSRSSLAAHRIAALYRGLGVEPIITDPASAELTKYAANAFLATKLTFVNSIASICEGAGASVHDVMRGMGADHRIGAAFINPGPGWGGSCFPKDTQALVQISADAGYDFSLLQTVVRVNDEHADRIVEKVSRILGGVLDGAVVAMAGLTFKAGTDDLRNSPALRVAAGLVERGAAVRAYDPAISAGPSGIDVCPSIAAACDGADVLLVMTEWPEFAAVDLSQLARVMSRRHIVDARNLLDPDGALRAGFTYQGVGTVLREPAADAIAAAVGI